MVITENSFSKTFENDFITGAVFTSVGGRSNQEDSLGLSLKSNEALLLVCDGMGGLNGGEVASSYAVKTFIQKYEVLESHSDIVENLKIFLADIDKEIARFRKEGGSLLRAGTTMVAVYLENNLLNWVSVGDSRIYIKRGNEMIQVTNDHTYEVALKENLDAGLISGDFFDKQSPKSDALISFLGINGLRLIDSNSHPFKLVKNDIVILMSDGVYKFIPDDVIKTIIEVYDDSSNLLEALANLDDIAQGASDVAKCPRDNFTAIAFKIK